LQLWPDIWLLSPETAIKYRTQKYTASR